MPIDVTCPSCHTRFQVSEKFAGKSGPCPKCKKTIKVPELKEQVVIHAPEVSGPKDSTGQAVLKPISRKEVRLSTRMIVAIAGAVLLVLIVAIALRIQFPGGRIPQAITILGAILLGPPLAFAGYSFLRDDELEPYRGMEAILRTLACGLVYAAIWGAYWLVFAYWYDFKPLPSGQPSWLVMGGVVPVMVAIGAVTAQASLDLELGTGALHYAMYLSTTVILRLLMGMHTHWQPG
jgi:predicted Zn finger-like uncharacterized protein